ncbi:DNA-binding protein [Desulfosarcina widdelii]|uniref:RNA-binding protein KhpB n=1 Tax=Desulfosarcina widdelii TaxID=947919 RepID=A0A5K7ZAN4_9BACT|nr:RNA-binding cell elongation regulator Jag/EloR [Desulfosarcina widdelii]BBO76771.1 DNA-binding protein [Desulfosarcina widdelii]
MPEVLEFQGKNVEQALENASDKLNLPKSKIKHEVVAYGSTGIFGLVGVKKAKIKVFVPNKKVEAKPRKASETKIAEENQKEPKEIRKPAVSEQPEENAPCDEELIGYGQQALGKIVKSISEEADISSEQEKGKLIYKISGGQSGVLIGKRGQTLEAIQYLLEKMINKNSGNRVRVLVDVEGYLAKRKSNLQQMAMRMADKAKRTKKPVTIGQMNSHDRRIIHIQLKDERGVRTQSLGDGYYRKLMIFPKKQGVRKKKS